MTVPLVRKLTWAEFQKGEWKREVAAAPPIVPVDSSGAPVSALKSSKEK
jgi:hypothetical protein